ncbi:MAG: hypothetical protein ABEJ74_07530 [Haloferacaceae archaeon]
MDRISALRNVEEALRAFEDGEIDLATAEQRTRTVLRTYATDFEAEDRAVYRAADGTTVVAASEPEARELVAGLTGSDPDDIDRVD